MRLPLTVAVKDFFGLYILTPFEQDLLNRLSEALAVEDKEILTYQLSHFTTVRRLIRHLDEPNAHGYTNFYTLRFGKDVSAKCQARRFSTKKAQVVLALARVTFDGGRIDVKFCLVNGVLFCIEYRSPEKIYYPPSDYCVENLAIWPQGV